MIDTGRTIEQIMLDSLRAEKKKVIKKQQRYSEQKVNPLIELITLQEDINHQLNLMPSPKGTLSYLKKVQPQLDKLKKDCEAYDKRDLIKVMDKEMACKIEIQAINEKISSVEYYASRGL